MKLLNPPTRRFWVVSGLAASVVLLGLQDQPSAQTSQGPTPSPAAAIQDSGEESNASFSLMAKEPDLPYKYEAIDVDFWQKVTEDLTTENFSSIVDRGQEVLKARGAQSEEGAEGELATAIGLKSLKISWGASHILMRLARSNLGSQIAQGALYHLDDIAQKFLTDSEELSEDFLNSQEFGPVHPDIQSFISFHVALYNQAYGFSKWVEPELKRVRPNSYWSSRYRYMVAIGDAARNRTDSAFEKLKRLAVAPETPEPIRNYAEFQLARLIFEKGDLQKAYDIYTGLEGLPVRERGRIVLERAWSKYYMRDYAKALGLLEGLEAPFFAPSRLPEQYVLKMLLYKTLCHYESVESSAEQFRKIYAQSFRNIRKRKDLTTDQALVSRALMGGQLQELANFINQLREERSRLNDYKWDEYEFYDKMLEAYTRKEKQVRERIQLLLQQKTREAAEELLDVEEQVAFLDYTAKLDRLRIVQRGERRDYQSERVSYLTFDRIYWPVQEEYWLDELENFTVILKSRCNQDQADPSKESKGKSEDSLPEEFQ